jgi:hypothetical protein
MMRLVLGIVVLVAILAVVAVGLPAHVTVARSVVINAPESAVFPYLNDLHRFPNWSPWSARDPELQVAYSGPQEGKGARVEWVSTLRSIGTGNMEITDSEPSHNIGLAVNYNGLEGTSSYAIEPSGSGSKVTWNFGYDTGSSPLKRWKGLMLDGYVGAEYRAGLDKLKARIEEDRGPLATPAVPTTPMGGTSTAPEQQPSAALPQGEATSPGPGAGTPPAADGTPPATNTPQEAQQTTPPAAEVAPPPVQPTPPPKSKRRHKRR